MKILITGASGVIGQSLIEMLSDYSSSIDATFYKNKPKIVINIEPIYQTLSNNSPVDMQSIKYMKDRNYLPDFLSSLLIYLFFARQIYYL